MRTWKFQTGLLSGICFIALAACASTPSTPVAQAPVESVETTEVETPGPFDLAMGTVSELVAGGNTPTAIDRLTQLMGDANLSEEDRVRAQFERGILRQSPTGFDLLGAQADFGTILDAYPNSSVATDAETELASVTARVTDRAALLDRPETTRTQRFETLFELGQHNEALDLMLSSDLKPDNQYLVAMYQIGYLCSEEGLTGPSYPAVEPDGTERNLQFCDFGK